jgi:hypothetical protein
MEHKKIKLVQIEASFSVRQENNFNVQYFLFGPIPLKLPIRMKRVLNKEGKSNP